MLTDSLMYAEHAKSGTGAGVSPSLDDVRLAVQARKEGSQVSKEVSITSSTRAHTSPVHTADPNAPARSTSSPSPRP